MNGFENLPKRGDVVDFKFIAEASLPDSPCLMLSRDKVVQESHIGDLTELLSEEAWANSKWKYRYTTDEWIPVFDLVDGDIHAMVDIARSKNDPNKFWVTPKTFPREEYTHMPNSNYTTCMGLPVMDMFLPTGVHCLNITIKGVTYAPGYVLVEPLDDEGNTKITKVGLQRHLMTDI